MHTEEIVQQAAKKALLPHNILCWRTLEALQFKVFHYTLDTLIYLPLEAAGAEQEFPESTAAAAVAFSARSLSLS